MTPTITAFASSPDRGRGLARDMGVRWALEEVGQPDDVRLLSFDELKQPAHRSIQPFGQIPTFEADGLALFESGAIVLHIARTHAGLLPNDAVAAARVVSWMFAAIGTIEPPIVERSMMTLFEREKPWFEERLATVDTRLDAKLSDLSARLGEGEWLEGAFSAGDLLTINVLRRLGPSGVLDRFPIIVAYVARGEARPAFRRAFASQKAVFEASSQSG